jgi:hypothetical protein
MERCWHSSMGAPDKPVRRLNCMLTLLSEGMLEASLPFMLRVSFHFTRYRMTSQG